MTTLLYKEVITISIKRKLTGIITAAAMLLSCMPYLTAAAEGEIATASNLKISTVEELAAFRDAVNKGIHYEGFTVSLENNITLTESNWTPIGVFSENKPFKGTFNGKGHTISGLNITTGNNVGLFGYVYSGFQETAAVKNVTVTGSINATGNAGGIVAYLDGGNSTVSCCHSDVAITGPSVYNNSSAVGGIVGFNASGTVSDCYSTGKISGAYNVGGVVGWNNYGIVSCCHYYNDDNTSVSITNGEAIGAIIGENDYGKITSCRFLSGTTENGIGQYKGVEAQTTEVQALSANDFKETSKFPNWDFQDTWEMGSSYPVLKYNPYKGFTNHITNIDQLEMLRDAVNAGNEIVNKYDTYYLDNDLDLTGVDWTPIGTFYSRFNSIFTGWDEANKKEVVRKITGLTTNEGSDRQGLFAFNEGTIKNLIFNSCNVSGESYVGCVAAENSGTIQNITVTGSRVTGTIRDTGGVVGSNSLNGNINNVIVTGATIVSGAEYVGGIAGSQTGEITEAAVLDGTSITGTGNQVGGVAGYSFGDKIEDIEINGITVTGCEDTGGVVGRGNPAEGTVSIQNTAVSGTTEVGGIGGYNYSNIDGSSYTIADLTVSGTEKVGGIFGYSGEPVSNFTSAGAVTGSGNNVGGIAGSTSAAISGCTNNSTVTGSGNNIGGIVGCSNIISSNNNISYCTNSGTVNGTVDNWGSDITGSDSIGGIVGYNQKGTVTRCHTTVSSLVKDGTNVGGIVGKNEGKVQLCYNSGIIQSEYVLSKSVNAGGVVGSNLKDAVIENCYNTADVRGYIVGGVLGINYGKIINCYSNGSAYGSYWCGGVVGSNETGGSISSCYYCKIKDTTYYLNYVAGSNRGTMDDYSRRLKDDEFIDETNFIDWDFNDTSIWTLSKSAGAPVFFNLKLTRDDGDIETGYYTDANGKRHDDATAFVVTLTCGDMAAEKTYVSSSITVGGESDPKVYEGQLETTLSAHAAVKIGIILTGIADKSAVLKAQAMIE